MPRLNVELFMRRTKLRELSSWKVRCLVKFVSMSLDYPTRSIRQLQTVKIVSRTNADLFMRRTKQINLKFL